MAKLTSDEVARITRSLRDLPKGAPLPTALRKGLGHKTGPLTRSGEIPGINVPKLQAYYAELGDQVPLLAVGAFHAPVDASSRHFEKVRNECINKYLDILLKQGWQPVISMRQSKYKIKIEEGTYPAIDALTGEPEWENMEWRIVVPVVAMHPQKATIELSAEDVNPIPVGRPPEELRTAPKV